MFYSVLFFSPNRNFWRAAGGVLLLPGFPCAGVSRGEEERLPGVSHGGLRGGGWGLHHLGLGEHGDRRLAGHGEVAPIEIA